MGLLRLVSSNGWRISGVIFVAIITALVILTQSDSLLLQQDSNRVISAETQTYGKIQAITQYSVVDMQNLEKREEIEHWDTCPRWFELASALKRCLLYRISYMQTTQFWNEIAVASAECGADLIKNVLGAKYLVNKVRLISIL